jgi:hypothetical protein
MGWKTRLLGGATVLAGLSLPFAMATAASVDQPLVLELFTSEGCSSCPPADALLAEFAERPEVLALSFHVDYWDRLGWKDPFSSPAATERQQRYAERLGLATVYTPQIVVDGKWQAVGSNRAEVEHAMTAARRNREAVPVTLGLDHGRARIGIGPGESRGPATVLLIGFDLRQVSAVARGENSGRTLAHADVVRSIAEIGQYDGRAQTVEAPAPQPAERVAVILQAADGRVLGAAIGEAEPQRAASSAR